MKHLIFNSQIINQLQSLPSLRGDVNEVDRGELLVLKIKNLELGIISTPPPLRGTSPQSREELQTIIVILSQSRKGLEKLINKGN